MKITRFTNSIELTVNLPGSKSESNRALILNAIAMNFKDSIANLSEARDTEVLCSILSNPTHEVNVGHAGTAMRFLTAYYSSKDGVNTVIAGSERMQNRPIKVLVDALEVLGANIEYLGKEGYPPLQIKGSQLKGGELEIDSSISSQYISALLMIAPTLKDGLLLKLKGNSVSKPYINMTIDLMNHYGVEIVNKNNEYTVGSANYTIKPITIESDWSAASYWYEIAALTETCKIELKGLVKNSRQGDRKVVEFYKEFGVFTEWVKGGVVLTKNSSFELNTEKDYQFNLEETPDLAQTLICTCAGLGLNAKFTGLSTLKIKETDRLKALKIELVKFGIELNLVNNSEAILKGSQVMRFSNQSIETYQDHRMAMSFAPLALVVNRVNILNPEVVKKSYPKYWDDLGIVFEIEI